MILKSLELILSTFGYLLFLTSIVKIRLLITPFVWSCLVLVCTYLFAIFGKLQLGVEITLYLGYLAGLIALSRFKTFSFKSAIQSTAILVWLLPILVLYYAIPKDFMFFLWDEVGGWARSQKLIYETNALLNANSPFSLRSYPPGQQIFQYYITKNIVWSEKILLLSQDLFIFSALLAVVGALVRKRLWACTVFIALIPLIYFFNFDYNTIYCDPLVACVFAGCLALALKPNKEQIDAWVLALCLCSFVLLKDISLIFSIIVIFVYGLTTFQSVFKDSNLTYRFKLIEVFKKLIICISLLSIIVLSWKWYVSVIGTSKTEMISLTLDSFMQPAYRQRVDTTLTAFMNAIFKTGYFVFRFKDLRFSLSLSTVVILVIFLSGIIFSLSSKEKRVNVFFILFIIAAGAISYLLFLLWLYLTYFTEYEGTRLASFERYSMTYLLAWLLVIFTWLMSAISDKFKSRFTILIPITLCAVVYISVPNKFYSDVKSLQLDQISFEKRKATQDLSDLVRKFNKPGERVFFLAQNTNGYERHLFDYAMLQNLPNDCWSVGKKYNDGDVWTCDQPLGLLLKGFSYLAIYAADQRFWNDNKDFFESDGVGLLRGVYKVKFTTDGQLRLALVGK